eukprot:3851392-Pyramimonas_sp.AAC.1
MAVPISMSYYPNEFAPDAHGLLHAGFSDPGMQNAVQEHEVLVAGQRLVFLLVALVVWASASPTCGAVKQLPKTTGWIVESSVVVCR